MKADEEEAAGAPSPNDATHEDVPADAEASAAASTSSETKHHTVVTEVPKFRFVSIAKKSAGYKSEYAGSYIEGKSAQELLAARQKELGLLRKSSTGSVKSKSAAADEVAAKNTPSELNTEERGGDDTGGLRKVGKLNINENKDEYSEEFIADVDGVRRFRKEGDLDGDEDAEKEESDKKDVLDIDSQEKSEAYESEEDDLEAQTAAVPPVTTTTLSLPISGDEKQNVVVNVSLSLATTSTSEAVGAVPVTSPTNGADTSTNKQEDAQPTKKCSTKKVILIALIVLLVVVVVVLGVALGTRSTDGKSELKDDANSSLNNNQDVANDANNDGTVTDPTPSESLAKWDAPTESPINPIAVFNVPTSAPVPTIGQRCNRFLSNEGTESCNKDMEIKQQVFVPRGGANVVNQSFGHSLVFINRNFIAAGTDGSATDASWSGVHIYYKPDNAVAWDFFQTVYGEPETFERLKFGYSLASNHNANTLVIGAPSRNTSDANVVCKKQWCDSCSWSSTDATPCGDRLALIVESSSSSEDQVKDQIMSSGLCIAGEICEEEDNSGVVYVFEPTGKEWKKVGVITSKEPSFGSAIAMEDNIIAIGSPDEDKVHIYEKVESQHWIPVETHSSSKGGRFGASLSMSEGTLIVGAPNEGIGGAAYVYTKSARGFAEQGRPLAVQDLSRGDNFGHQVSVSDCTLAVSAKESVRIFNYDASSDFWVQDQNIIPFWVQDGVIAQTEQEVDGFFGECLVMEGDNLLIGSSSSGAAGTVTHFTKANNVWTQHEVVSHPTNQNGNAGVFGCGVALLDRTALVGTEGSLQGSQLAGSFFISDLCPDDEPV